MPESPGEPHHTQVCVSSYLEPIFSSFLAFQQKHLATMAQALATGDFQTLRRMGHMVKGSASTYELPTAAAMGEQLETAALASDLTQAAVAVAALRDYLAGLNVTFID